jgi:hypothetical protein
MLSYYIYNLFFPKIKNSVLQWEIKLNGALAAAETWAFKRPYAKDYHSNSIYKYSNTNCTHKATTKQSVYTHV